MSASRFGNAASGARGARRGAAAARGAVHAGLSIRRSAWTTGRGPLKPTYEASGIRAANSRVQLKARGVRNARSLRALGFNALDLVDASWCLGDFGLWRR